MVQSGCLVKNSRGSESHISMERVGGTQPITETTGLNGQGLSETKLLTFNG